MADGRQWSGQGEAALFRETPGLQMERKYVERWRNRRKRYTK